MTPLDSEGNREMGDKCVLDLLAYGTDWTVVSFKPKRKEVKVGE